MRVGNSRGHKEAELLRPGDGTLTEAQITTLVNLFEQDRLKGRVKLFRHVFNQEPTSEGDTELELPK
jgi:hypothetical protein